MRVAMQAAVCRLHRGSREEQGPMSPSAGVSSRAAVASRRGDATGPGAVALTPG